LNYLTPNQRHKGLSESILEQRRAVIKATRLKHPERWSGTIQNCSLENTVWLNPAKEDATQKIC